MERYSKLNRAGRRKILEFTDDYAQIPVYVNKELEEEELF